VDLAYDEAGAGPAVVLIHGHPFNRSMWTPQLTALADGYRVIAPDLRGYGDSPVTPGTVPMSQLAADVARLLDGLAVARAALVGLSMGGLVAMELAIADPARWWALGLVATTAEPITGAERADRLARADQAEREGIRPLAEGMAARLYGPGVDPAVSQSVMTMMLATDPRGAAAALRGRAERPDYRPCSGSWTARPSSPSATRTPTPPPRSPTTSSRPCATRPASPSRGSATSPTWRRPTASTRACGPSWTATAPSNPGMTVRLGRTRGVAPQVGQQSQ
jgi:pimeloyl-ACP methyl ester carboxylesterase